MEGAALADRALHPDLASHHLHESGRNRQPQAGASEFPRGGSIRLRESAKDQLLFLGRNANTRVPDRKVNRRRVLSQGLQMHLQGDLPLLGKLDGITQEVHDDLAQAGGIAADPLRHLRLDLADQLKPFLMGTQSHRVHRFLETVAKVERHRIKGQLSRLDL